MKRVSSVTEQQGTHWYDSIFYVILYFSSIIKNIFPGGGLPNYVTGWSSYLGTSWGWKWIHAMPTARPQASLLGQAWCYGAPFPLAPHSLFSRFLCQQIIVTLAPGDKADRPSLWYPPFPLNFVLFHPQFCQLPCNMAQHSRTSCGPQYSHRIFTVTLAWHTGWTQEYSSQQRTRLGATIMFPTW